MIAPVVILALSCGALYMASRRFSHLESGTKERRGNKATSILPIGVTNIIGDFERNDIVKVIGADGTEIGVGRTAYSSAEARQCIGQRNKKALVHYDYLYIQ